MWHLSRLKLIPSFFLNIYVAIKNPRHAFDSFNVQLNSIFHMIDSTNSAQESTATTTLWKKVACNLRQFVLNRWCGVVSITSKGIRMEWHYPIYWFFVTMIFEILLHSLTSLLFCLKILASIKNLSFLIALYSLVMNRHEI